ncbi:hypothetical protein J6590_010524 [Homalodisca vitripennis]|nr:hypothetical protein J6590_010524 [Homalodisca vitripennis]
MEWCSGYGGYREITESINVVRGCYFTGYHRAILSLQATRLPGLCVDPQVKFVAREFIDTLDQHTFSIGTGAEVILPLGKAHPSGRIPLKKTKLEDLKKIANSLPHDHDIQQFWTEIYD